MSQLHGAAGPRRVLLATTVAGTISSFLLPYADHLRARGWRVEAATSATRGHEALGEHFDAVHEVPWSRRITAARNSIATRHVRRLLDEGDYDLIHTHTPVASFVSRVAAATLPPPRRPVVVYTAHGLHFGVSEEEGIVQRCFAAAERLAGRWTDRLVVINPQDRETATRGRLVPADRLTYMPGIGVDTDWYRVSPETISASLAVRSELGIAPGLPIFAVLASLEPGKRHADVVEALARSGLGHAHLIFAGNGPLRGQLAQLSARRGIGDRVHLLGSVDDVRPLIAASTATVLASRREGLSRAVLESLAMGVPVIGTAIRGIAELVEPGGGLLMAPGDVNQLAAHLVAAVAPERAWFDEALVRARLERYSIGPLLALHDALYEELLSQR